MGVELRCLGLNGYRYVSSFRLLCGSCVDTTLQRSSAHSLGFRNRSQRLLEYAERRQDIMSVSSLPSARVLGKRPAVRQESLDRPKSFSSIRDDEKHAMGRTLIFGQWNGSDSLGYVHLFVIWLRLLIIVLSKQVQVRSYGYPAFVVPFVIDLLE